MPEVLDDPKAKRPEYQRKKHKRVNLALAGVIAATTGQSWNEIAPQVGSVSGNALGVNMHGKGITKRSIAEAKAPTIKATLTAQVVSEATEIIRDRANSVLALQIGKLAAKKPGRLASKGQGEAAVLKTMAETWRTLNGNPDQITVQFGANMLSEFTPSTPPVANCGPVQDVEVLPNTPPVQVPE